MGLIEMVGVCQIPLQSTLCCYLMAVCDFQVDEGSEAPFNCLKLKPNAVIHISSNDYSQSGSWV